MTRGTPALFLGAANVGWGIHLIAEYAPRHESWAALPSLLLGLLNLWLWWHGGGGGWRRRARRWLGAKSAALRAALVRRLAEEAA